MFKTIAFLLLSIGSCTLFAFLGAINEWKVTSNWWAYFGIIAWCWFAIYFGKSEKKNGRTGVIALDDVAESSVLRELASGEHIRVSIMRQSGNEDRWKLVGSKTEAFHELEKVFRRKKTDRVRVWKNTQTALHVQMPYYHGKGNREGGIISGVFLGIEQE